MAVFKTVTTPDLRRSDSSPILDLATDFFRLRYNKHKEVPVLPLKKQHLQTHKSLSWWWGGGFYFPCHIHHLEHDQANFMWFNVTTFPVIQIIIKIAITRSKFKIIYEHGIIHQIQCVENIKVGLIWGKKGIEQHEKTT